MKKHSVVDVIGQFSDYYKRNPAGGSLHLVLEDGNVKDSHVLFCLEYAKEKGDSDGVELAKILMEMSKTQRLKLSALTRASF